MESQDMVKQLQKGELIPVVVGCNSHLLETKVAQ
jgi:hypothetical protein